MLKPSPVKRQGLAGDLADLAKYIMGDAYNYLMTKAKISLDYVYEYRCSIVPVLIDISYKELP